jgi:hypothetical protein
MGPAGGTQARQHGSTVRGRQTMIGGMVTDGGPEGAQPTQLGGTGWAIRHVMLDASRMYGVELIIEARMQQRGHILTGHDRTLPA